jgi:hypothetical protein
MPNRYIRVMDSGHAAAAYILVLEPESLSQMIVGCSCRTLL